MKLSLTTLRSAFLAGFLSLALIGSIVPMTFAHNGEEHGDAAEAEAHENETTRTLSLEEMERMISLLTQLLSAILEHRKLVVSGSVQAVIHTEVHTEDGDHGEDGTAGADGEDGAHDGADGVHGEDGEDGHDGEDGEDGDSGADADEAKLVIEVEMHNGKTHVHIRYVDKPEAMFFVDANISDEHALIEDIEAVTDLTGDEIETALTYM